MTKTSKEILEKVLSEKKFSQDALAQKKQKFRDRELLYNNINTNDDKVRVNMIRGLTNTLLALYYDDTLSVKYASRSLYSWMEAENFQNVAEYDYEYLDMEVSDYRNQKNRFLYGVGVRALTGFNDIDKHPTFEVINPKSCFMDPNGFDKINNFSFFGFERNISIDELKESFPEHASKIKENVSEDELLNKESDMYQREMIEAQQANLKNKATIYYHYTIIDGEPIQALVYNDTLLLSAKKVGPLTKKKGKSNINFPIALNYWDPIEGDPFGISLYDVVEDKQKLKTLFLNLMKVKAIREALGGKMFIDRNIFAKNKTQLMKHTVGPLYIPVDGDGGDITKMVYQEPNEQISPDVYNMPNMLDALAESDTGIGDQVRGVSGGQGGTTATEIQNKQLNANVNLLLGNKINARGEKTFWTLRYKRYDHYFSSTDEKFVRLNKSIMSVANSFERRDFITDQEPDIYVEMASQLEAKKQKQLQSFMNYGMVLTQDPGTPPVAKRFIRRKILKLLDQTKQEIELEVPYTYEEMDAKEQVLLMNKDIPVEIGDIQGEDHYTYLMIYQTALSTPATKSAIAMRKTAYIQSGQAKQYSMQDMQQQGQGGVANSVTNQMVANEMSQQNKGVPSVQAVL